DREAFKRNYGVSKDNVNISMMNGKDKPANVKLASIWSAIYENTVELFKKQAYFGDLWKHVEHQRHKDIKKDRNGSFMALVLQTLECKLILKHFEYCQSVGYKCESLQFDGFLVRKDP